MTATVTGPAPQPPTRVLDLRHGLAAVLVPRRMTIAAENELRAALGVPARSTSRMFPPIRHRPTPTAPTGRSAPMSRLTAAQRRRGRAGALGGRPLRPGQAAQRGTGPPQPPPRLPLGRRCPGGLRDPPPRAPGGPRHPARGTRVVVCGARGPPPPPPPRRLRKDGRCHPCRRALPPPRRTRRAEARRHAGELVDDAGRPWAGI